MSTYVSRPDESDLEYQLELQGAILMWYDEALATMAASLPLLTASNPIPSELAAHRLKLVDLVKSADDLGMLDLHQLASQQLEDIELTIAMS